MKKKEITRFYPTNPAAWRKWLEENHLSQHAVWLVFYYKSSANKSISWREAVDVALCFGWIDSKKKKIDKDTYHQYFSRRKPKSTWSKINKQKVQQLIDTKLMTEEGYKSIQTAKNNGSWTILDEVEELIIPKDLERAFAKKPTSKGFFLSLSKSDRKAMLQWLVLAKNTETRQKRLKELVRLAEQQLKPKHMQANKA